MNRAPCTGARRKNSGIRWKPRYIAGLTPPRLTLFGGFQLSIGEGPALILPVKAQALLAYLVLRPGETHPRDKLAALLWGDAPDSLARDSLRHVITTIRKAIDPVAPRALAVQARTVMLDAAAWKVDVIEFLRRVDAATPDALDEAAAIYRGDLLEGLALDEPLYEQWLLTERERLRERAVDVLARQFGRFVKDEQVERAIQIGVRLLMFDPIQEAVHRSLMQLYMQQGRRGSALKQYQACVSLLQRELGAEPETETKQLYREILLGQSSPAAAVREQRSMLDLPNPDVPLVGREAELDELSKAAADVWSGHARVVGIAGEAGIGKTTLLSAVAASLEERNVRLLVGRSYESEKVLAFGPWVDALRGVEPVVFESLAPAWRLELSRILPAAVCVDETSASAASDAARLFEGVRQLLLALAREQPVVVMLEDMHWADDMSARLLAFLARRLEHAPVFLIFTVRDDEVAPASMMRQVAIELQRDARVATVTLAPLSEDEATALVRQLAHATQAADATSELEELAWSLSQGNPFVLVETVRASAAGTSPADAGRLPKRIRDLMVSRLRRLHPFSQQVISIAAVIGRESDFALLSRVSGLSDEDAAAAVEELVRRHVLRDVGDRFEFLHERLREVALGQLVPARIAQTHRRIADALEVLHAGRLDDVCDRLAYHYAAAEDAVKAVEYLKRAAVNASRAYAYTEAIALLKQALALAATGAGSIRERTRAELVLQIAHLLYFVGGYREALDLLLAHDELVERIDDSRLTGPFCFLAGRYHSLLGEHERAIAEAQRAADAGERCGDDATMGRALFVLSYEGLWRGRFREGARQGRQASELLAHRGEQWWSGMASWMEGMNRTMLGEFDAALEVLARTNEIGERIGDDHLICCAAWSSGWAEAGRGDTDAGVEACSRAVERSHDHFNTSRALSVLGYVYLERGDALRAIEVLEQALDAVSGVGIRTLEGLFLAWLADAHRLNGEPGRARERAQASIEANRTGGFAFALALAHRVLGRVERDTGRMDAAEHELRAALQMFTAIEAAYERDRTLVDLAGLENPVA